MRDPLFGVTLVGLEIDAGGLSPEDFGRSVERDVETAPIEPIDIPIDGELHEFHSLRVAHSWIAAAVVDDKLVVVEGRDLPIDEVELRRSGDLGSFEDARRARDKLVEEYWNDLREADRLNAPIATAALQALWRSPWRDSDSDPSETVDDAIVAKWGGRVRYAAALDLYEAAGVTHTETFGHPVRSVDGHQAIIEAVIEFQRPGARAKREDRSEWGGVNRYGTARFAEYTEPNDDDEMIREHFLRFPLRLTERSGKWVVETDLPALLERALGPLSEVVAPIVRRE
jgi:hypothetical protein